MYMGEFKEGYRQLIEKEIYVPIMLWGISGVAKTAGIQQLAKELGFKLVTVILSQKQAVDISGMPNTSVKEYSVKINHPDGKEEIKKMEIPVMSYHLPEWFMDSLMDGNTILFLDELNRAKMETIQAVFDPVVSRVINGIKLPKSVYILSANNPSNSKHDTLPFEDNALITRFVHVQIKPSAEEFIMWGKEKNPQGKTNIHPNVLRFVDKHGTKVFCVEDEEDLAFPVKILPNWRSAEYVSHFEYADIKNETVFTEFVRGCLADEAATMYIQERKNGEKEVTLKELFEMSEETIQKIKDFSSPNDNDVVRIDLLGKTARDIIENEEQCRPYAKQVLDFCELVPIEIALSVMRGIYSKEKNLWPKLLGERKKLRDEIAQVQEARTAASKNMKI